MKTRSIVIALCLLCMHTALKAQLEKVIVEKYYVSDAQDAADTSGSALSPHSTTYRVYIDMAPGCQLLRLYGNSQHEWRIASDSLFYNHKTEGQTFGNNFNVARYSEGTVALDTWLALGQTTTTKAQGKTYFGVLKPQDRNGSLLGGSNNSLGLLSNNDPAAGIPLTVADGLDTMNAIPTGWINQGIVDFSGNDSSIFGSIRAGKVFSSRNAFLQNNGVMGVNRDSNQVLVAQLTTKGKLSFALNVQIKDSKGTVYSYVAQSGSDSTTANVIQSPALNYPLKCGCVDANYLEYNSAFGCADSSACKTLAVLGCMDPAACNYDPKANINLQDICCYPGNCNNRDISLVCPDLGVTERHVDLVFSLSPNPAYDLLHVSITSAGDKALSYELFDSFGRRLGESPSGVTLPAASFQVDVSGLSPGMYLIRLKQGEVFSTHTFIR
jgi:hypothetical protein